MTGRAVLRLFDLHSQAMKQRERLIISIPAHRADLVIVLANECTRTWMKFAKYLRTRAQAPRMKERLAVRRRSLWQRGAITAPGKG